MWLVEIWDQDKGGSLHLLIITCKKKPTWATDEEVHMKMWTKIKAMHLWKWKELMLDITNCNDGGWGSYFCRTSQKELTLLITTFQTSSNMNFQWYASLFLATLFVVLCYNSPSKLFFHHSKKHKLILHSF